MMFYYGQYILHVKFRLNIQLCHIFKNGGSIYILGELFQVSRTVLQDCNVSWSNVKLLFYFEFPFNLNQ
jgi:hypothetical protein